MKGDKAAAASGPFSDFGDQQHSHWEVRTPIASSYLGNKEKTFKKNIYIKERKNLWKEKNDVFKAGLVPPATRKRGSVEPAMARGPPESFAFSWEKKTKLKNY